MRKSRFTEEQIRYAVQQAAVRIPVPELCRRYEVSPVDVLAVGMGATIPHYDGSAWKPMAVSTEADPSGVRVTSAGDSSAVGAGGTILRYGVPLRAPRREPPWP